jgi:DNA-binding MarR family transcriptional regulator
MTATRPLAPGAMLEAVGGDYRVHEQIGFVLRKANQRHLAIFAAHIGDMTPPQFATLAKLAEVGETSQNQLGALVAMDAATIKGVIDRLRGRGLVELRTHEEDRRRVLVSLTPAGGEALARLVPAAHAVTEETLSPLSAREAATLMRLLAKLA